MNTEPQHRYQLEHLQLFQLKNLFHEVPFFMSRWNSLQSRYHDALPVDPGLKRETYNPRYTGELPQRLPEEVTRQARVRLYYERICCSGKNNCSAVSMSQKKNKKTSMYLPFFLFLKLLQSVVLLQAFLSGGIKNKGYLQQCKQLEIMAQHLNLHVRQEK
jgi:hypothetical protein